MTDDKTDDVRERASDGTVGGTVDDDPDTVLTLDTPDDEDTSSGDDDSDSTDDDADSEMYHALADK